jgi:hypothetical protein
MKRRGPGGPRKLGVERTKPAGSSAANPNPIGKSGDWYDGFKRTLSERAIAADRPLQRLEAVPGYDARASLGQASW